jgi:uncharacterized membrane protein YhaH (DUF805 family)
LIAAEVEMDWVYLFTAVHGRITRQWFWIGFAVLIVVEFVAGQIAQQIQGDKLGSLVGLALDYPEFAVAVKRANDRNLSVWAVASFFIVDGFSGLLSLISPKGALDPTNPIASVLGYVQLALLVVLIADLGFRRGTVGPNRFGPDPLGGKV